MNSPVSRGAAVSMDRVSGKEAVALFAAFALAYFLSALVRAITGTLAPVLTAEFQLAARDLGLLAGGYFFGFALTQLPLGMWLDRWGPRDVLLRFLGVAVVGCAAFALAHSFEGLLLARVLCGVGVSACLMAPLTGYRRWFDPAVQLRANAWMLMTGSTGMVAATLPVAWVVPLWGWRPVFWMLAALLGMAMLVIAWRVPAWSVQRTGVSLAPNSTGGAPAELTPSDVAVGYAQVWRSRYFRRHAPMAFLVYGGLIAMQTLWAGPWLSTMAAHTGAQAAAGLFWINMSMLTTFAVWGWVTPLLVNRNMSPDRLMAIGLPLHFLLFFTLILTPWGQGSWAIAGWALSCVSCTFISLAQPAVGMAFPANVAGRALSAYNLLIFFGVFSVQWGIGGAIDALLALGWSAQQAYRGAFCGYGVFAMLAYVFFAVPRSDNRTT
jgi:MFS family permease